MYAFIQIISSGAQSLTGTPSNSSSRARSNHESSTSHNPLPAEIAERVSKLQAAVGHTVIIVPGNEKVRKVAEAIQAKDMDVRPIMSPTVSKEKERIRICLHAYNTSEEIDDLLKFIKE